MSKVCESNKEDSSSLVELFSDLEKVPHNLIEALRRIQSKYGYLPPKGIKVAAEYVGVPYSQAYSVATFYHQYSLEPVGKYRILLCMGTACHLRGNDLNYEFLRTMLNIEKGKKTTKDGLFSVEVARCFGCCGLAPVVVIENPDGTRKIIGKANARVLRAVILKIKRSEGKR